MSGIFGSKTSPAQAEAKRQAGEARREMQVSSEEDARARQRAERGAAGARRGRDMLIGQLSGGLKSRLGG